MTPYTAFYISCDGHRQRATFKTIKGLAQFVARWVGIDALGDARYSAVSDDGIGRCAWTGATADELRAALLTKGERAMAAAVDAANSAKNAAYADAAAVCTAAIVAADAAADADAAAAVDPADLADYARIAHAYEDAVDAAHAARARSVLAADVLRAQRIYDAARAA